MRLLKKAKMLNLINKIKGASVHFEEHWPLCYLDIQIERGTNNFPSLSEKKSLLFQILVIQMEELV